ncbi:MAG: branched-chain amino acid ABC transporter permease [Candidatus Symbiobacter sp.]|nr:branched-chain amino acid ABC transporter permease [Candidatus Symbiobacter sp.]
MTIALFLAQILNSLQLGLMLFLLAAGLTLVFGIMNFVNLAHGTIYMMAAYGAALVVAMSDHYLLGLLAGVGVGAMLGVGLQYLVARRLYGKNPLYHVLASFGLILMGNELVRWVVGPTPLYVNIPPGFAGQITLMGVELPTWRGVIIAAGLTVALGCYGLIHHTKFGMRLRAAASNRIMLAALGVNVARLELAIFALGGGLAGLAAGLTMPLVSVLPGMGEPMLISALIVIVIGGIGSVRGAFLAALVVGMIEVMGRAWLIIGLQNLLDKHVARAVSPALSSLLLSLVMAVILAVRPGGLFAAKPGGAGHG